MRPYHRLSWSAEGCDVIVPLVIGGRPATYAEMAAYCGQRAVHARWGGQVTYCSRTGLTGEGVIPRRPDLVVLPGWRRGGAVECADVWHVPVARTDGGEWVVANGEYAVRLRPYACAHAALEVYELPDVLRGGPLPDGEIYSLRPQEFLDGGGLPQVWTPRVHVFGRRPPIRPEIDRACYAVCRPPATLPLRPSELDAIGWLGESEAGQLVVCYRAGRRRVPVRALASGATWDEVLEAIRELAEDGHRPFGTDLLVDALVLDDRRALVGDVDVGIRLVDLDARTAEEVPVERALELMTPDAVDPVETALGSLAASAPAAPTRVIRVAAGGAASSGGSPAEGE